MNRASVIHPFAPVYDSSSRVLILGSFPSVKSREEGFYYMHPQNRFWKTMSNVFGEDCGASVEKKTSFLLRHQIALWDSIASCTISGSSDASLRDAVPNDIPLLLKSTKIRTILCNGKASFRIYRVYLQPQTGIDAIALPSTSAANASWSLQKLSEVWKNALLTALAEHDRLSAPR